MPAQIDPVFLPLWVRAELEAKGELKKLAPLLARAREEGLDDDEAELDATGQIAERHGWLDGLERATGEHLWLQEVREARGASERLERGAQGAVIAFLFATAGATGRLAKLAAALEAAPEAKVSELLPVLGGSPGCSVR